MIVLDEHLPIPDLADAIGRWYRGRVCTVSDLRPHSIVKDEAVPDLLRTVRQPTFVTLNWADFWRRVATYHGYCVIRG